MWLFSRKWDGMSGTLKSMRKSLLKFSRLSSQPEHTRLVCLGFQEVACFQLKPTCTLFALSHFSYRISLLWRLHWKHKRRCYECRALGQPLDKSDGKAQVTYFSLESQHRHQGFGNIVQCCAEPWCMADLLSRKGRMATLACEQRKSKWSHSKSLLPRLKRELAFTKLSLRCTGLSA